MCNSYLVSLKNQCKSPYTVETASAAIAKLTGFTTKEINKGIERKSKALPKKGRGMERKFNDRQEELRKFATATGLRKSEIQKLKAEQIVIENGMVSIDLSSKKAYRNSCKSGRPRIVTAIEEKYTIWMEELKKNALLNELHRCLIRLRIMI